MDYSSPLTNFRRPKAKIDFITIGFPIALNTIAMAREFHCAIKGRIEVPKGRNKDWITIHDPKASDLQWLLDNHPTAQIKAIEVAIDFTLLDGSNDPQQLSALHGWLKTRLFPQRHPNMEKVGKRKYYDARTGQIRLDTLLTRSGNESVYWTNPKAYEQLRLYIKTKDNGNDIKTDNTNNGQHPVRLEATLFRGGCQNAGLYRVAELPLFAGKLRWYLSKFLYVANGIKPKIKRTRTNTPQKIALAAHESLKEIARVERAWQKKGAAWAAKHGHATIPDTGINRSIGVSLKNLRDVLIKLKLTQKVAEHPGFEVLKTPENKGLYVNGDIHRIEGQCSFDQSDNKNTAPRADESVKAGATNYKDSR